MPFSNNDLLLPVSCLLNLSGACDIAILAKNNRFFIKYDGIVGIADNIDFIIELKDVHTNIFVSDFLELSNLILVEKDFLTKPEFKLCEYSKTGNTYWTLNNQHYLFAKTTISEHSQEKYYYCELTKFVSWLKSIGKEISIESFDFHLFVSDILKSIPECRFQGSKEIAQLLTIFYDLWGNEAFDALSVQVTILSEKNEPTHTIKNHKYLTSLIAEEAALIACGIEEFPTLGLFKRELKKWTCEDGSLSLDMELENGDIVELPINYSWEVFDEAHTIFKALLDEVYCALRWIIFASHNTEETYFDEWIDSHPPEEETVLRLDNFDRDSGDGPDELKITKKSLVDWFLLSNSLDKASLFNSNKEMTKTELPLPHIETKTIDDLLEDDHTPTLMVLASSLYDSAWKDLPSDMKNPTRTQLGQYIKSKLGIQEDMSINVLIRVSKPDKEKFGGKQRADLKEWKPKGERN